MTSAIRVAFCSRGRGRGHAVPDMAILDEWRKVNHRINPCWISYGTGAATLRACGREVIDLNLSDKNPFLETLIRLTPVLASVRPDLVISHEEFAAVVSAQLLGIPALCITDYFLKPEHLWMQALQYADEIIFIDEPGHFDAPTFLEPKVFYTGVFSRLSEASLCPKGLARKHLGIPEDTAVLIVFSGNWSENQVPVADLVFSAFEKLPFRRKIMRWFAGSDANELKRRLPSTHGIDVVEFEPQIEPWLSACDVAITKGTRKIAIELWCCGILSISLSPCLNSIDDVRIGAVNSDIHLEARETDPSLLARTIVQQFDAGRAVPPLNCTGGLQKCAERLEYHVNRLR